MKHRTSVQSIVNTRTTLSNITRLDSDSRYRCLFEHSQDAIFLTVPDGSIRAANAAACRMFGMTEEELCLAGREKLIDTSDPHYSTGLKERERTGKVRCELRFIRKNGEHFHAEVSSVILEGREEAFVIVRDISERKRDEQAVRRSEQHYRSLFENMLEGYAHCKMIPEEEHAADFEFLAVNCAFEELTGLKDVVGKKITEVFPGIRESNPEMLDSFFRVASTSRPERFEMYLPEFGIWFIVSAYSHERGCLVAIFNDISDRKNAEQTLKFANEQLEKHVSERTSELKAKTMNLEEVNTALRVLLDRREEDRKELEEAIAGNLKDLILPYIQKLQGTRLSDDQATYLSILQSHFTEIESRFVRKLSLQHIGLTPTEMQIAVLIRDGKETKEIAEIMHVSVKAIEFHRNNIRRKLSINNKKENLRTHLITLK